MDGRGSESGVSPLSPPSLPPKTRKLLAGAQETARAGSQESTGSAEQPAQTTSTNTTKRQHHQLLSKPATSDLASDKHAALESEASVSVVRIGPGVTRSVSSAGSRPVRTKLVKPLRRSKSHLTGGPRGVTNITHGGSVTLVSLNNQEEQLSREFQPIEPDLSPR